MQAPRRLFRERRFNMSDPPSMSPAETATASAIENDAGSPPASGSIWSDRRRLQRLRWPIMIGAVVLVVAIGLFVFLTGGRYESTDDASVQGARVSVAASISGRVVDIQVHEGQPVKAGDVLFRLDGRPYQTAVEQAAASLASARLKAQ